MMPPSRETKYQQVAKLIKEGYISPAEENMPLPTERQLQDIFAVSRATVRRALRELAEAGLIYHVQGSGTYVAPHKQLKRAPSLRSFTEDMAARGHRPHSLTLACHLIQASRPVQRDLNLDAGAQVIQIQRLRQADGSPIALETAHFLPEAFSHLEPQLSASLDAQMQASGFQVETATLRVAATNLTQAEAAQLGVPLGAAALRVEKVGYTLRGLPVESTQTLYRGDRYDLEVQVKR
ncbi:GntR family transcriptional regulator [Rothia sp. 88186D007BW]